jgi:hypothetical protein
VGSFRSLARSAILPIVRPAWRKIWARVETRVALVETRFAPLQNQTATLETRLSLIGNRLPPVESRTGQIENRLAPVEDRLAPIEDRLAPIEARLLALDEAWRRHIPEFLNAVGTVSAFAHELRRSQVLVDGRLGDAGTRLDSAGTRLDSAGTRLDDADTRLNDADTRLNDADTRLNDADTRLGNADASISSIWERIEFVRREILFEMAHGSGQASAAAVPRTAARIVSSEKVASAKAQGTLRLNLGCGHIALPDHVNVDMRDLPGVDVIAEVDDLPFEPNSVDEIFSAHLLEHFPQEAMRQRLLPYWFGLLRPGGLFRAVTPDAAAMLAGAGGGTYGFEDFREVVFGAQDYVGDYHFNLFTPDSLGRLLEGAGFRDIQIPVAGRRNGKCFEFEVTATRA